MNAKPTSLRFAGYDFRSAEVHRAACRCDQLQRGKALAAVGAEPIAAPRKPSAPRRLTVAPRGGWTMVEPEHSSLAERNREAPSAIDVAPLPPQRAQPVFINPQGQQFIAQPTADSVILVPFVPTRIVKKPAEAMNDGGFVPAAPAAPVAPKPNPFETMIKEAAQQLPRQIAQSWLTGTAVGLMSSGLPGSPLTNAWNILTGGVDGKGRGVGGIVGDALLDAVQGAVAGHIATHLGKMVPSIGSLIGGKFGTFIDEIGIGTLPGKWAKEAVQALLTDPGKTLSEFANALGELAKGGGLPDPGKLAEQFSLSDLKNLALKKAADYLMGQWKITDESSAAETIVHFMIAKYQGDLLAALTDSDRFFASLGEFFSGKSSSATLMAAHVGSLDVTKPNFVASGFPQVLVTGLPIARFGDLMTPVMKPIADGVPLVLSGGLPTARQTCATLTPGAIETGAATVLIGDHPDAATTGTAKSQGAGGAPDPTQPATPAETTPAGAKSPPASGPLSAGDGDSLLESLLGKLWNAPNTALGLAVGGVGQAVGEVGNLFGWCDDPTVSIGNNAVQFHDNPLMASAMTLGNVILYGGSETAQQLDNSHVNAGQVVPIYDADGSKTGYCSGPQYGTVGDHERQHTYQGEDLGPFYLPAWGLGALNAILHGEDVHGPHNPMENGPQSAPPTKYKLP
jgi:uncharacterized Zn-binding protein involved in type VI secretion